MQLNLRVLSCANIPRPEEIMAIDPYITFNLNFSKKLYKTRVINNTFDPVWKQDFQIPIDASASSFGIDISLRNSDAFREGFEIGSVTEIIEDLKPYEVRNESFEIHIVDIEKEKRDAESLSKQISPDHLYTPKFIPNTSNSNANQIKEGTESENKDASKADDEGNIELNNNQNRTYVTLMFQIAPKYHPPFTKEGTPPRPYEPKVPTASYRKGNSIHFLQQSFGPPYIPRSMYERYSFSQRSDRQNNLFSFRSSEDFANRRQFSKSRDLGQTDGIHSFGRSFDTGKDSFTSSNTSSFLGSKPNFGSGAFQFTPPTYSKYRSRRKATDPQNSISIDDKSNNSGFSLGNSIINNEEANFAPLTPRKLVSSTTTGKSSNFNFNFGNYPKPNSSKSSTTSKFTESSSPSFSYNYIKTMQPKPPSSSPSSSTSPTPPTISIADTNYGRPVPKTYSIYNRNSNQQDLNNIAPLNSSFELNKAKYNSDLQKFHEMFRKNQKQKQIEKVNKTAVEGPSAASNMSPSIARSSNKNQKEKADNIQSPFANNDQKLPNNNISSFDYSNIFGDEFNSDDNLGINSFIYSQNSDENDSDEDEDESDENGSFLRQFYKINGSSNDTISEDDDEDEDDYSEMEDDNFDNTGHNQPTRNESSFRYYYPVDNIRKRSSSSLSNNNYSYSYQPKYSDDDQSDTDDVVEIDPPNFGKEQPKLPKKNINYNSVQPFQPPPKLKSPTNTTPQSKAKGDANTNEDVEKKEKKAKKDIRFFFGSSEENNNPTGDIKFVFNNSNNTKSQKSDNKTNETNQVNGNSNENAVPVIFHYQTQKKGNSKKQGNRDDSPSNN